MIRDRGTGRVQDESRSVTVATMRHRLLQASPHAQSSAASTLGPQVWPGLSVNCKNGRMGHVMLLNYGLSCERLKAKECHGGMLSVPQWREHQAQASSEQARLQEHRWECEASLGYFTSLLQ